MPTWTNDLMTILNTIDTALGVVFLAASWFGFRAWLRSRSKTEEGEGD